MKVKKFNNIWTMGLIIFGALLVLFYFIKIFFPHLIIGVAETPRIVAFGNFVDSHLWSFIIYNYVISFSHGYIYCCACCRQKYLTKNQTMLFAISTAIFSLLQIANPQISTPYNYVMLVFVPFVLCLINKRDLEKCFKSTAICFSLDIMTQALSLCIRNIILLSDRVNSAVITVLLIDVFIWRFLMYFYFNETERKEV